MLISLFQILEFNDSDGEVNETENCIISNASDD